MEDCWWTDPRRSALIVLLGGECRADGCTIRAWKLGQDFWKHERGLVPLVLFEILEGSAEMLRVGLAEVRDSFVYVRGSSAYLDWVAEKREQARAAGKKSAEVRRNKTGSAQPKPRTNSEQTPNDDRTESNDAEPSVSFSGSGSQNEEPKGATGVAALTLIPAGDLGTSSKSLAKAEQALKANLFVAAYVKAYQTRFPGGRPEDLNDGKVRGQMLGWLKDYPLERACELIQVYFQMDTKWFGAKGYDFLTFRNNLNTIGQALDSGQDPAGNTVDWKKVFA